MKERLVIIGGVAAGMSAAAKARRTNPNLEIVVYEKSGYISYGACGFPYFIKGDIHHIDALLARTPAQMAEQHITALVHHEVVAVNPQQQTVRVMNRQTGHVFTQHWDKLIIAAGASVLRPPIPGIQLPGIFALRVTEDALAIRQWLEVEKPRKGVIVGAGYVGLEMAEALRAHNVEVTIVDMADQVMPTLDADMAALVQADLQDNDVAISLQQPVKSFIGPSQIADIAQHVAAKIQRTSGILAVETTGGLRVREVITEDQIFPADVVIFGIGGRPNTKLAEEAGIAISSNGAIQVDEQQRTNLPNIWAAGTVTEAYHHVIQTPAYVPLATTASKQGRVAGTNAAGGWAQFDGIVGSAVVKSFDLTIAHTGLPEKWAKSAGFDPDSVTIEAPSRAEYMPGHEPIHVKLVFERETQRLLGAQIIGKEGVAKRIDVIAAALHAGWTTYDLAALDLSYAPPVSPLWDPILVAANVANR